MPEPLRIFGTCACGLIALSLGACASTDVYDPEPKFAKLQDPAQDVQITGSRIERPLPSGDFGRESLSPTSVLTREYIDSWGGTDLQGILNRHFPRMMSTPSTRLSNPSPRGGGGR